MAVPDEDEKAARRRAVEEEEAYYAHQEYLDQQAKEEEAEKRNVAIEDMVNWFSEHFEDPQNETQYDSEDGQYVYVFGGPFDAREMLDDSFAGEYEDEWIEAAVEQIQSDGTFEWAPTSTGDFYEHPEVDPIDADEIAADDDTDANSGEIADRIFEKLGELEKRIAELVPSPSNLGHNQPPEDIGLPPYDDEAKRELLDAIEETRDQVSADAPSPDNLQKNESIFRKWGAKILGWVASKGDLIVDETIKASVKPLVWTGFANYLLSIADDIILLIKSF